MASKNSMLLIIKQKPGIHYNDVLVKISSEYSNINSARAALSRLVKDLDALGLLRRKGSQLFLTDKGILKIQTEMKNKLILKLNDLVKESNLVNPEPLVQQLSVLIERAKQDSDLLKVAKSSTSFPVSKLEEINDGIQKRARHLNYLSKVISKQSREMRSMDFRDSVYCNRKHGLKAIEKVSKKLAGDFIVRAPEELMPKLREEFDGSIQGKSILFQKEKFNSVAESLLELNEPGTSIIAGGVRIELEKEKIKLTGPAKRVKELTR